MPENVFHYEFNGFRFYPESLQIEVIKTESKSNLSPIHAKFLLTLLKKSPREASYEDFNNEVWVHFKSDDKVSLLHTIQATKSSLVKIFRGLGGDDDLIVSVPKKGYTLSVEVKAPGNNTNTEAVDEKKRTVLSGENTAHILIGGGIYGLLFGVAIVLEIAYQFNRFGLKSLILAVLSVLFIAATTCIALLWTEHRVETGKPNSLAIGVAVIIVSAVLICLSLVNFLPSEPITAAGFQTQTAFGAYLKNVFFYFVPPFIVFGLIPFHFIATLKKQLNAGNTQSISVLLNNEPQSFTPSGAIYFRPLWLGCLMVVFAFFSLYSSYNLFDFLQTGQYHNLFISLLIARNCFVFGLCAASLIWYEISLNNIKRKLKNGLNLRLSENRIFRFFPSEKQKFITFTLLSVNLFSIYLIGKPHNAPPHLESVEFVTPAISGTPFFVNLTGNGFISETVCVRVTGNDCLETSPCLIPNGALKKHGSQSETALTNVPLSLGAGKYQLFTQNADSPFSNAIEIDVTTK